MMTTKFNILIIISLLASVFQSCSLNSHDKIRQASALVDERPDSAYEILKEIDYRSLSKEEDKASYILTHAKTNLNLGKSLISDTIIPIAVSYYKNAGNTAAYVDAVIAQAHHLRSVGESESASQLIDSIIPGLPNSTQRMLNQELLGFSFADKDHNRSLEIIERQIQLSNEDEERFEFEVKKITQLLSLDRNRDAILLCDSLFNSPNSPKEGSRQWFYMKINYASALGGQRETVQEAIKIFEDILHKLKSMPESEKIELYIPLANIYLNAGNVNKASEYISLIESSGCDITSQDPVAIAYLDFLKIAIDYEKTGILSINQIAKVAQNLRRVSNDLDTKRQERDVALITSYNLSRDNYELTIKTQRMWIAIILSILVVFALSVLLIYISHRRRANLIEAEERIETLEEMLKSANSTASTDNKHQLLKKLLLQQLGILKTFAEAPTTQNQEALRKISKIGKTDPQYEALVNWDDLYPVIDELYGNFHALIIGKYPELFSEREIQILCLMRADFSTKEIGVIIQQTTNSIYVSKTAIRKKLGLQNKEDFMNFLTTSIGQ